MYTPIHKNKSEIPSFLLEKANGTRKYSMDCSCPGFPYCFARVYPLKKLDSIYIRAVEPDFKKSNKKPDAKVGYRRLYPTCCC